MAVAEQDRSTTILPSTRSGSDATSLLRWGGLPVLRGVVFSLISIIFLIPFIWMFFGSLRRETEIFQYLFPLSWHTFYPIEWTLSHYRDILGLSEEGNRAGLNFGRN